MATWDGYYCKVEQGGTWLREKGRRENVLHISAAPTVNETRQPITTVEGLEQAAKEADWVMIYVFGFPRRGVAVEKAGPHFRKLIKMINK